MKKTTKAEAKEYINSFFTKSIFSAEEMHKTKRLAMKYKIKIGEYRKLFCKKCLSQLNGNIKINIPYKTVICSNCNYKNKFKLS